MDCVEVCIFELVKVEGDVVSLQILKDVNLINQYVQCVKVMLFGEVGCVVILKGIVVIKGVCVVIEVVGGKFED